MNPLKIKNSDYLIALSGYFLVAFFILGGILLSPGTVGFFHDWFIGPYPEMNQFFANGGFYIWDSQSGNKLYPTDWIFRVSVIPFSFLGGEVLSKMLLVFILTLSGFSAFCLAKQLKLGSFYSFAAGILYIFSPIIFSRIVAGHIYYLIAYSLSPLILSSFLKGREEDNKKYFVVSGLLTSFAIIQFQFLIMIFIILLVFSLVDHKKIKKSALGLTVIFSLAFLIDLSPLVFSGILYIKESSIPFSPLELLSSHDILTASNLTQSIRLLGADSHPYSYVNLSQNGTIPSWILYLDFIIPIVGFSSLIFRKNIYTISFAVIAAIGLFILKGLNPPLSIIFKTIFLNGFYIFREIWHISFLYGFSLSFLVALFLWKNNFRLNKFNNYFKILFSLLLISLVVISNGYPLLTGNFAGYLQNYNLPEDYHRLYDSLSTNSTYNILILPLFSPIRYDSLGLDGIDPLLRYSSNNIFIQTIDPYHPLTSLSTWLYSVMEENRTNNLGKLLSGFGIKYIILRKDFISNYPNYVNLGREPQFRKNWYSSLEPFLDAQRDLVVTLKSTHYKIYENKNDAKKISVPLIAAGGLSDFSRLLPITNFTSLSNIALYPSDYDKSHFIELGKYATAYDANKGWTNGRYWFGHDYLLASRIYQGAFSMAANSTFGMTLPKYDNKSIEIWMKVLEWPKGGGVNINVNGVESFFDLFSSGHDFPLIKIFDGKSDSSYHFLFRNVYGENYIEGIYIKEKEAKRENNNYTNNKSLTSNYQNITNINLDRVIFQKKPAIVDSYAKLNPTLWKVHTTASKPFVLNFAESYDPLWEARVYKDGKKVDVIKSDPAYGVINSFQVNQTGNLDIVIRYRPQDGYEAGLVTSGATLVFCVVYLFYNWSRNDKRKRIKK